MTLAIRLSCETDRMVSRVVRDHVHEEETIGISDSKATTSLGDSSLIALEDAIESGCVAC